MFNITNLILFHKITYTPSGLCSPFAYNILSFYKHALGLEGSAWPYRRLMFTHSWFQGVHEVCLMDTKIPLI